MWPNETKIFELFAYFIIRCTSSLVWNLKHCIEKNRPETDPLNKISSGKFNTLIGCWKVFNQSEHFLNNCLLLSTYLPTFLPTYLGSVTRFGKISPLSQRFTTLWQICDGLFGKMLSLLWQICDIFGLIFIVANGLILKNNLAIWSSVHRRAGELATKCISCVWLEVVSC